MATYKPIRKTENGTEEIKIPYAVLADPPDLSKYVTTDGGTINKSKTIKMDASANSNGANLKWGTVNSKNPYIGYASDQSDGTFVVGSLLGTNYASGLAIGGGSGNLLWKGTKVATTSDIPAAVTENTVSGWGFTKNIGTVTSVQANGTNFKPDATGKVNLGNIGGGSGPLQFADTVVMTEAEFSQAYIAGTLQEDKLYLIEGETGTVNFVSTADHIVYNNANSGLTATNLQGAVDEINSKIFSGSYNDLTDKPTLFSGSYNDLTDKPTLFSGSYDDLIDKPTLFSGSYNDLTDKPTLFSGSYNDLTDKPAALTQTDILTLLNLTEEQLTKLIALLNKLTVDTTSVKFNNTTVKATTFDVQ